MSSDASDAAEDPPNPVEAVARALRAAIPYTGEFTAITGQVADVDQVCTEPDFFTCTRAYERQRYYRQAIRIQSIEKVFPDGRR